MAQVISEPFGQTWIEYPSDLTEYMALVYANRALRHVTERCMKTKDECERLDMILAILILNKAQREIAYASHMR